MAQKPSENKQDHLRAKVTTRLFGITKKKFFADVQLKNISEAELAREIITKHYL
jgi:hypothetical protein